MAVVRPDRVGPEEEEGELRAPRDGQLEPEGGGCCVWGGCCWGMLFGVLFGVLGWWMGCWGVGWGGAVDMYQTRQADGQTEE